MNTEANGHRVPSLLADRLPPANMEAEQGVLGSVLLDNDTLPDVVGELAVEDFYRDSHQTLFRHVLTLYQAGKAVDAVTLAESLILAGELGQVGNEEYLAEVINSVPHAANAKFYAQIVRQKAVARGLIEAANKILSEGYANRHTADDLLELAEKAVLAVGETGRTDTAVTAAVAAAQAMDRIAARHSGSLGLPSGISELDKMTDGFHPGQMIVIAARPSMGKTAFALNITEHVSLDVRGPVLYACAEMTSAELAERMIVARSHVPGDLLRRPNEMNGSHYHRVGKAYDEIKVAPLTFDDASIQSVLKIASTARREHRRYGGLAMIVVDYLQLLRHEDRRTPRHEQVAEMSRALKIMARDLKCPVVVLSQLNREVEKRQDYRPRMADLRESGAIEADADMVLLLHRPEYYDANDSPGVAEVIVAKNRNGPTGTAKVTFRKSLGRFEDTVDVPPSAAVQPPGHAPADDILGDARPKALKVSPDDDAYGDPGQDF